MLTGAGLDYRDAHRKSVTPRVWLRVWAAQYPGQKCDLEHDRLVALTQKEPADFERIGKWKDARRRALRNGRRTSHPSLTSSGWRRRQSVQLARRRRHDRCFLQDWSSREYEDRFSKRTVKKRFGLSRATTLLYFLSHGRFPIFDSRVRRAIARLTGRPVPNTDRVTSSLTFRCSHKSPRPAARRTFGPSTRRFSATVGRTLQHRGPDEATIQRRLCSCILARAPVVRDLDVLRDDRRLDAPNNVWLCRVYDIAHGRGSRCAARHAGIPLPRLQVRRLA